MSCPCGWPAYSRHAWSVNSSLHVLSLWPASLLTTCLVSNLFPTCLVLVAGQLSHNMSCVYCIVWFKVGRGTKLVMVSLDTTMGPYRKDPWDHCFGSLFCLSSLVTCKWSPHQRLPLLCLRSSFELIYGRSLIHSTSHIGHSLTHRQLLLGTENCWPLKPSVLFCWTGPISKLDIYKNISVGQTEKEHKESVQ